MMEQPHAHPRTVGQVGPVLNIPAQTLPPSLLLSLSFLLIGCMQADECHSCN